MSHPFAGRLVALATAVLAIGCATAKGRRAAPGPKLRSLYDFMVPTCSTAKNEQLEPAPHLGHLRPVFYLDPWGRPWHWRCRGGLQYVSFTGELLNRPDMDGMMVMVSAGPDRTFGTVDDIDYPEQNGIIMDMPIFEPRMPDHYPPQSPTFPYPPVPDLSP